MPDTRNDRVGNSDVHSVFLFQATRDNSGGEDRLDRTFAILLNVRIEMILVPFLLIIVHCGES
jgi:hypothetical protein